MMPADNLPSLVATIVREAGGQLVGRTRLQKVTYLRQLAGFGSEFPFEYHHYGPYSEELATATTIAGALDLVSEEERRTDWGGWYSIYTVAPAPSVEEDRRSRFVRAAAEIGSVELELAATAAFLFAEEKVSDAWTETARRKPEKAGNGRLERAKMAYSALRALSTPCPLPIIS